MISQLIGDEKPGKLELSTMRERGGYWYAYQNHDLGSRELGRLQFLQCGEGRTYTTPPDRMPDTPGAVNWRYILVGVVDLKTGKIIAGQFNEKDV